jgi:hypothetical protein
MLLFADLIRSALSVQCVRKVYHDSDKGSGRDREGF